MSSVFVPDSFFSLFLKIFVDRPPVVFQIRFFSCATANTSICMSFILTYLFKFFVKNSIKCTLKDRISPKQGTQPLKFHEYIIYIMCVTRECAVCTVLNCSVCTFWCKRNEIFLVAQCQAGTNGS